MKYGTAAASAAGSRAAASTTRKPPAKIIRCPMASSPPPAWPTADIHEGKYRVAANGIPVISPTTGGTSNPTPTMPRPLNSTVEPYLPVRLAVAAASLTGRYGSTVLLSGLGMVGVGLLVPPVVGLMTGIPFAATLYFPSWMSAVGQAGGGLDAMGQRMIFAGGFLVVLAAALLPAALAAGVPYFIVLWTADSPAAALVAGAGAASLVLIGELAAVVWWLGGRYDRFDLSTEVPQS